MRPGLQGFTGLYGALVFFKCVLRVPPASPSHLKYGARDRSPGEALGGSWAISTVDGGRLPYRIVFGNQAGPGTISPSLMRTNVAVMDLPASFFLEGLAPAPSDAA